MKALEKRRKAEDRLSKLRKERAGHEAAILANMRQTRFAVRDARALKIPMRQIEELTALSHMTLYRHMTDPGTKATVRLEI